MRFDPTDLAAACARMEVGGRTVAWTLLARGRGAGGRLLAAADESPGEFLTAHELDRLPRMSGGGRVSDWIAGRVAAKIVLVSARGGPPDFGAYEVLPDEEGRPVAWLVREGRFRVRLGDRVSISHRGGAVGAALILDGPGGGVGFDIELLERRDPSFLDEYFAGAERELLDGLPPDLAPFGACAGWSLKEAALKATGGMTPLALEGLAITSIEKGGEGVAARLVLDGGRAAPRRLAARLLVVHPHVVALAAEAS